MLRVLITTDVLRFFMQDRRVFGSNPEMRRTKEGWDPPFFLLTGAVSPFNLLIRQDLHHSRPCHASNEESDSSENLVNHHLALAHADCPECPICTALDR